MNKRNRIGGLLDLESLAKLHGPSDEHALRRAATSLAGQGLKPADIAQALGLARQQVEQLLRSGT